MLITSEDVRNGYEIKGGRIHPILTGMPHCLANKANVRKAAKDGYNSKVALRVWSSAEKKEIRVDQSKFLALYYGFELNKNEVLYHIDDDNTNINIDNLKVATRSAVAARTVRKNRENMSGHRNITTIVVKGKVISYRVAVSKDHVMHREYAHSLQTAIVKANRLRKELYGDLAFQEEIKPEDMNMDADLKVEVREDLRVDTNSVEEKPVVKMPTIEFEAKKNPTLGEIFQKTAQATLQQSYTLNTENVQKSLDKMNTEQLEQLIDMVTTTLANKMNAERDNKFGNIQKELDALGVSYVIGFNGKIYENTN